MDQVSTADMVVKFFAFIVIMIPSSAVFYRATERLISSWKQSKDEES